MYGGYSVENVHGRHDLGKVDDVLAIMAGPEIQMPKSDSRLADDVRIYRHKFAYSCLSIVDADAVLDYGRQYKSRMKGKLIANMPSKYFLVGNVPVQDVTKSCRI
jgi:hypothetical protein